MVSLQQSSHFFGKLLIVAGLEDLNFTFYKMPCISTRACRILNMMRLTLASSGYFSVFKGNNFDLYG